MDKDQPKMLSREPYDEYYTHQGWLMEDQTHLLLNDELDELQAPTHTLVALYGMLKISPNPTLLDLAALKQN